MLWIFVTLSKFGVCLCQLNNRRIITKALGHWILIFFVIKIQGAAQQPLWIANQTQHLNSTRRHRHTDKSKQTWTQLSSCQQYTKSFHRASKRFKNKDESHCLCLTSDGSFSQCSQWPGQWGVYIHVCTQEDMAARREKSDEKHWRERQSSSVAVF